MPLVQVVLLAALQGFAEVLPVSLSGHDAAAALWLPAGRAGGGLTLLLHLATAGAIAVAVRRRLASTLLEGVRAIARPSLFGASPEARDAALVTVAAVVSLVASAVARPRVESWASAPTATGLGLLATGLALASLPLAPKPRREAPSFLAAAAVGLGHGLAVFPGASPVGAALTLLIWTGVRPSRAVDLALLITLPTLLVGFLQRLGVGVGRAFEGFDAGTAAVGLLIGFLAAVVASAALRRLVERKRVGALSLWIIPLGLAMLAYARALPHA